MSRAGRVAGFPDAFLWGAATSGYQVEGGASAGGKGPSIWDVFTHRAGHTWHGDTGDVACDAHDRARLVADLDLLRDLGADAYIFSVQWPRVQPDGRGPVSQAGLDYYRFLVDALRARGLEPIPTLYHWELPQALQRAGGWRRRTTAARFAEYASVVQRALGSGVSRWITQNEPHSTTWLGHVSGTHAPGLKETGHVAPVAHHLLLSHAWALQALRAGDPEAKVGLVVDVSPYRPSTGSERDRRAARRMDAEQNRLFLDPLFARGYPASVVRRLAGPCGFGSVVKPGDLDAIASPLDFLGVNYYAPRYIRHGRAGPETADPPGERTSLDWAIDPPALCDALERVRDDYTGTLPLWISENGAACRDYVSPDGACHDVERIDYLNDHLVQARHALQRGVPLQGYFVWSLLDNFEWNHGYRERFGLVHVDFGSQRRTPKDSWHWLRGVLAGREALKQRAR